MRIKSLLLLVFLGIGLQIQAQNSEYIITVNTISMTISDDGQCSLIEAINTVKQSQASGITDGECMYDEGEAVIVLEGGTTYPISEINNNSNGLPLIDIEISIQSSNENLAILSRVSDSANFRFFEISDTGQLHLEGIRLENGISGFGGAILNEGTLVLENANFTSNTGIESGGAIHNTGILEASSVVFDANRTLLDEPFSSTHLRLIDFAGGAIFNGFDSLAIIRNGLFFNNEARIGGGIFSMGTAMFYDSEFHDNRAKIGGAIFNYQLLSVYNTYLHHNEGISYGGAIYTDRIAFVSDSRIILNISLGAGGGIATDGITSIVRTTITGNSSSGWGGGISNYGNLFLLGSSISENQSWRGGGISNSGSIFLDECCTSVIDNIAEEGVNIYEVPENPEFDN